MVDLPEMVASVQASWVYTPDRYPALAGLYQSEKFWFTVKHSNLHVAKSLVPIVVDLLKTFASITAACEYADHGDDQVTNVRLDALKTLVAKLYINTLSLATITQMDGEELQRRANEILLSSNAVSISE